MAIERTLSIIKPDAISKNLIGTITDRFEKSNLRIIASKMIHLTKEQAQRFYAVHKERPFYDELVTFMSSTPVLVQIFEGENAIFKNRELMGATNPKDALPNTIRADFAESITKNILHGSDSKETAKVDIAFFFGEIEIFSR